MIIAVDNRSGENLPEETYRLLALFVLEQEEAKEQAEVSLSLVTEDEIQQLNKNYRGIDAPTDVLSFENDEELLGDVIICPHVARQHALDFDSDFVSEMELMLVHGLLHLLGYDHVEDTMGDIMEARENELLALWRKR